MSTGIWPWRGLLESGEDRTYSVEINRFGDRYEQRIPIDQDNRVREWPMVFENTSQEIKEMVHFLDGRRGVEAFLFEAPDTGSMHNVVCTSWRRRPRAGTSRERLSATFREVPFA